MNYLLQVTLCWGVFALLYALLLRGETFFTANRLYLLATSIAGLALPILAPYCLPAPPIFVSPAAVQAAPVYTLDAVTAYAASTVAESAPSTFDMGGWIRAIWAMGITWFGARFLWGLGRLWQLKRSAIPDFSPQGDLIYRSEAVLTPFSFLHWILLPIDYVFEGDQDGVVAHEQAHVAQRHSLDILWVELLCVVAWFHPLAYWYRGALRAVHEYAADAASARRISRKQYGLLLIRQSQSGPAIAFANHFFQSPLKQRLIMLTKQKSARARAWRYVPVVPLLFLLVLVLQKTPLQAQQTPPQPPASKQPSAQPAAPSASKTKSATTKQAAPAPLKGEAFDDFIAKNLRYPAAAKAEKREGTVHIMFNLAKDGTISDVKESYSQKPSDLTEEAIRVIKSAPGWYPGEDGKGPARPVIFVVPVKFELEKREENPLKKMVNSEPRAAGDDVTQLFDCATQPMFPTGEEGLQAYLANSIKYPAAAKNEKRQGTVVLHFIVEKDGSVTNIKSLRPAVPDDLAEEAIRVVQAMPKWTPGADEAGHFLRVAFTLPIRFKLE